MLADEFRPPGCTGTVTYQQPAKAAEPGSTACCAPAWIPPVAVPAASNACERKAESEALAHTMTNPPSGRAITYVGSDGEASAPGRQEAVPRRSPPVSRRTKHTWYPESAGTAGSRKTHA